MYKQVKVIEGLQGEFEDQCNALLKNGWDLEYVSCPNGHWKAMFTREEYETEKPVMTGGDLSAKNIVKVVAKYFRVKPSDLKGGKRTARFALPRHLAIYLVHTCLPNYTFAQIGEVFNDRHHSTIMNSIKKVREVLLEDNDPDDVRAMVRDLNNIIYGEPV